MGLSTHVLDTANGKPAAGMTVSLYAIHGQEATCLSKHVLNNDGRTNTPLFSDGALQAGTYRLAFEVAAYFKAQSTPQNDPPFLNVVLLDFGVADPTQHYHVPLLVSPWAYSTYRGS
ncbi:hydroxyisourate hydrolase [Lampropedia puyangensis]|uniref:5-hydroxyisourate hydrolase n=1 Tax=Lampropedia puyangensis TaxID=1330072 RepID=A0A4S8FBX3_9BURK|nr:hydroxyisourate hydrolase [Lampropedia puyangensis]THU04511.1 hydroxyisourate hydrolase [Lampropedia puyangensis]